RQVTVMRTTGEWVNVLESQGVPCGAINTIDQVFANPQTIARGMCIEMPHPQAGSGPLVANPIRFSETPVTYRMPPPTLGQHTARVWAEWLGLDATQLRNLRETGAI